MQRLSNPNSSRTKELKISSSLPHINTKFLADQESYNPFMHGLKSLDKTTHTSSHIRLTMPGSTRKQNKDSAPSSMQVDGIITFGPQRQGRNASSNLEKSDKRDNTFPSIQRSHQSPKGKGSSSKEKSSPRKPKRPYSQTNAHKMKTLESMPKGGNASQEDLAFYKMLRLTDSYV